MPCRTLGMDQAEALEGADRRSQGDSQGAAATRSFPKDSLGFPRISRFVLRLLLGFYKETGLLGGPGRSWEGLGRPRNA